MFEIVYLYTRNMVGGSHQGIRSQKSAALPIFSGPLKFLFCRCSSDFSTLLSFIFKCFVPILLVNFKNTIIFCSISDTKKKNHSGFFNL